MKMWSRLKRGEIVTVTLIIPKYKFKNKDIGGHYGNNVQLSFVIIHQMELRRQRVLSGRSTAVLILMRYTYWGYHRFHGTYWDFYRYFNNKFSSTCTYSYEKSACTCEPILFAWPDTQPQLSTDYREGFWMIIAWSVWLLPSGDTIGKLF